jgi:WD40 repeat protein
MTWVACKDAIQQCYEGSDGLFFLSLQADRYGYLPLPKYLNEEILLKARKDHENDSNFPEITHFLDDWYRLDENQCPPRYELKRLSSLTDPEFAKAALVLKDCLLDSVTFEILKVLPEEIVVNRSVTQWETFYALDCDKERCYWVQRIFSRASLRTFKGNSDCWKITDIFSDEFNAETPTRVEGRSTAEKLEVLHSKMKMYLKEDHRVELLAHCSPEAYLKGEGCEEYLEEWERVTSGCLEKELKKVIDKSEQWNAGFVGIPVDHLEEIIHHGSTFLTKANNFFEREELLEKALEMAIKPREADQKENESQLFSGVGLALVGRSGCGKTALISKLALSLSCSLGNAQEIPTILRFCGTSRYSLNGLKLIQSISLQMLAVFEKKEELKELVRVLPSQDYKAAVEVFQKLVAQYPIYLLIDSLDQLENRNEERSKLSFLRDLKPHEQSIIIVSTLPDEYEENGKPGKYFYQCEKTLASGSVPILKVGIMEEIEVTIKTMLKVRRKKLTNHQWMTTLQAVSHEPTILYINLAMEVISQWRSFEKEVVLRPTVKGLIHQIFGDLELSYGNKFASTAFAMITFSREGVNDPELQDLLSLHEGVMTEVCQYSKLHFFPIHAWLRLKQVIKNLVTEKENHCIKWYHRQLWETAGERYSEKEKECHEIMGKYFTNLVGMDMNKEKDIIAQPLILNEVSVWMPESIVNRRRVVEGYYHLIKGGLLQEAVEEVCSLEFVCCSALVGDLSNSIRYLGELIRLFGGDNGIPQHLDHYYRWMRRKATRIVLDPRRQTRMTAGEEPLISFVKKQVAQLEEKERNELGLILEPMTFGCADDFDALELELLGHTKVVASLSWNHDGSKILSGSDDRTIKIWDAMTGELLNTLEGHSRGVTAISWNHDSSKIVSGSKDRTIKIWDVITCDLILTLKDGENAVNSVSWNHHGSNIASTAWKDTNIRIWDAVTGELLRILSDHAGDISSVSWNHDDTQLLSGSYDQTVKIWNSLTGELLKTLHGHSDHVSSASWSHDSSQIVSGSWDKTIKIWDGFTGNLWKTLEGNSSEVLKVIWNDDSSKILSGSDDGTIIIWNAVNGEPEETVVQTNNDSIAWNHDGSRIASGSWEGKIRVWKGWGKEPKKKSDGKITSLSEWNPADKLRLVTGFEHGRIKVWNGRTGALLYSLEGHSDNVSSVAWNHDGTKMASQSDDKTIKIWDGGTYELLNRLEGYSDYISWNHDSSWLLSVSGSRTFVWDGLTGKQLKTVDNPFASAFAISWNHEMRKLLIGCYEPGIVAICDGETLVKERQLNCGAVFSVSWSHDYRKIISCSRDKTIQIWNVEDGSLLSTLKGHSDAVRSLFWSHDDSNIFSGSRDGTIRIWEGSTGRLLKTESIGRGIMSMSLTSEEDQIAFRCEDHFVRCISVVNL